MTYINFAVIYVFVVAVTSCMSYALYGFDKMQAGNGGRRIPEQTLHLLALLGGWPGAMLGQRQFRHKTKKTPFQVAFWFTVVAHIAMVAALVYLFANRPLTLGIGAVYRRSAEVRKVRNACKALLMPRRSKNLAIWVEV